MQVRIGEFNGISASAPVIWCLSNSEIKGLAKYPDEKWLVMIIILKIVGNEFYEESRYCRPLTSQMAYIEFRNPGKHLILAGIMNRDYNKKSFLSVCRHYNGYNIYNDHILNGNNKDLEFCRDYTKTFDDCGNFTSMQASLTVSIDEKLFAPKPADYDLVCQFFDTKPIDQCHHRKRRFLAYFLLLTVAPLTYLWRLAWFLPWLLLTGLYTRNWRWFLHPVKENWRGEDVPMFFAYTNYRDKDGKPQKKPAWRIMTHWRMMLFIWPTLLLILYAILELLSGILLFLLNFLVNYQTAFSFIGTLTLTIMSIILIVAMTYVMAWSKITKHYRRWRIDRQETQKQLRRQARKQLTQELRQLGCDLTPKEVSLTALPKDKQTIYLRFSALKARVCRPFAGSLKD